MMSVIANLDPIWNPPQGDAPRLQHDAYAALMMLINSAARELPELLTRPQAYKGDTIVQQAISASLSADIDPTLLGPAVELLHARISQTQPETRLHVVLPKPKQFNALSDACGARLTIIRRFIEHLEAFIAGLPRDFSDSADANAARETVETDLDNAKVPAGMLAALLVVRSGQTSVCVIGDVLAGLDRRITVAGVWSWIDVRRSAGRGSAQLRRVFLDPITTGAYIRASTAYHPSAESKASPAKRVARTAFASLCKAMDWKDSENLTLTLDELCRCQGDWLHVNACPLLSSYASTDILHSSLSEDTWLRILGCELDEGHEDPEGSGAAITDEDGSLTLVVDKVHEASRDYQIQAGDIDPDLDNLVCRMREIMRDQAADWAPALQSLATTESGPDSRVRTPCLMVRWMHHLTTRKLNTGSRLAPGTINYLRGLLANRAISLLPEYLDGLDADQLTEAYTEVIEDAGSEQLRPRIAAALSQFDRYVRTEHIPDLPSVRLSGFEGGQREVSALIATEAEYLRMLAMTSDGTIAYRSAREAVEDRAFLVLGFRFGLRRSEILGLQARDIRLGADPALLIRANAWRSLKTRNAVRTLPLAILSPMEMHILHELLNAVTGQACVFFPDRSPTLAQLRDHKVVLRVRELLKRIAPHGRRLHPHNLRHSFASLTLFGMMAEDLDAAGSPYLASWMTDAIASARRFSDHACGALHRYGGRGAALGMAAGHGSEVTTYEHYTHVLDLLLFLHCTSARMMERDMKTGMLSVRRGETKIINAIFGYHTARGLDADGIESIYRACAARHATIIRSAKSTRPSTSAISSRQGMPAVTMDDLLSVSSDHAGRGFPTRGAPRDTANATLAKLNKAMERDADALLKLLNLWKDSQSAEPDWAYFKPKQAGAFIKSAARLGLLPIDVRQDIFCNQTRRHRLVRVAPEHLSEVLKRGEGTFSLRVRDGRDGVTAHRSKNQSSVTWTLLAFRQECCRALKADPVSFE